MFKTSIGYHTLSLFRKLTWEETDVLMSYFQCYSRKTGNIEIIKDPPNLKGAYLINFIDKVRGVKFILWFNNHYKKFRYYGIEVILNPKILSGENDYIRAANETHLPKAVEAYNALVNEIADELSEFDMKLPLFADYLIKRVDYCINFDIFELYGYSYDLDILLELLIELIRRGNIPFRFKEPYDKIKKRRKSKDDSFYLKSGSMTVNCYSKYAEWLAEHPERPGIEEAKYVIRFELQCHRPRIRYMLKKATKFMTNEEKQKFIPIKYLLSDEVSVKIVWDYFTRVIMQGDYYSLYDAINLVEKNCYRHPKHNRLIKTLKYIANCQGIDNARKHIDKFKDEIELQKFDKSLYDLAGMGINPVTLPGRRDTKYLPGLLRIYTEKMKNIMFNQV